MINYLSTTMTNSAQRRTINTYVKDSGFYNNNNNSKTIFSKFFFK